VTDAETVLSDVHAYALTIPAIVGRLLGTPTPRARKLLDALVRERHLFRHQREAALYFTASPLPLSRPTLRQRFAVAWFCHMTNPPKDLVPPTDVAAILSPIVRTLGGQKAAGVPVARDPHAERLMPIVLAPPRPARSGPDLNRALNFLQQLIAQPAFRPWLYMAGESMAVLTYLHPEPGELPELRRWLVRHPLCAPLAAGQRAIGVPVEVAELKTLQAGPR
jgi:hypothetical protein